MNPNAPWPIDPAEGLKLNEMLWAGIDQGLKSGRLLEVGWFANAVSGYAISTADAKGLFAGAFANFPWSESEVHEVLDYETGKELARQVLKAKAEQMAAVKR